MSSAPLKRSPTWRRCRDADAATSWLGAAAEDFHRGLAESLLAAEVDRIFLIGPIMGALYEVLPRSVRGGLCRTADEAIPLLLRSLRPGDVVTVKGSRAVGLRRIVDKLRAHSARLEA